MYIFEIIEVEQIIFSYLDYHKDFNVLRQVNKNYKNAIDNNKIYNELRDFDSWDVECIEDRFVEACMENIFIAKYLFHKYPTINIHHRNERAFRRGCRNGNLDLIYWLWQLDGKIDLHADNECAFRWSCASGHLNIAKWLWQLDGKINLHADNEFAFRYSCSFGHLDVVKWLWQLDGKINLHAYDEHALLSSYLNCYYDVAKWLWDLSEEINLDFIEADLRLKIIQQLDEKNK